MANGASIALCSGCESCPVTTELNAHGLIGRIRRIVRDLIIHAGFSSDQAFSLVSFDPRSECGRDNGRCLAPRDCVKEDRCKY